VYDPHAASRKDFIRHTPSLPWPSKCSWRSAAAEGRVAWRCTQAAAHLKQHLHSVGASRACRQNRAPRRLRATGPPWPALVGHVPRLALGGQDRYGLAAAAAEVLLMMCKYFNTKLEGRQSIYQAYEKTARQQAVVVRLLITALPRLSGSNVQICKQRPVACQVSAGDAAGQHKPGGGGGGAPLL